jgi:hypothetical protein
MRWAGVMREAFNRFWGSLGVRHKLLFGYSLLFLAVALLGSALVYVLVRDTVRRNIENELATSVESIVMMVRASADVSVASTPAEGLRRAAHGCVTRRRAAAASRSR